MTLAELKILPHKLMARGKFAPSFLNYWHLWKVELC